MISINEYYQNEKVLQEILDSVDKPGFRIWKVEKINGCFVNNTKKINSVKKLKELIGKDCDKIYVSVSQFLNPEKVYGKRIKKSVWKVADNIILKSDLLFDLDSEKDLSIAHEEGKKIIEFMKGEKNYELKNIRFSGSKGFHLLYTFLNNDDNINESSCRALLISRIPNLSCLDRTHLDILQDTYRVQAAIGSVKAKTGYKVQTISLEDFMSKSTTQILQSLARPVKPMTESSLVKVNQSVERTRVSSRFYFHFITNQVPGTNRYIPVLKYNKDKQVTNLVKSIQDRYNLGTLFKIVYQDIQMYVGLKVVDKARLEKIMKASNCYGLSSFLYFGYSVIPFSDFRFIDGTEAYEKTKLENVMLTFTKGETSLSHFNLMKQVFNLDIISNATFIGKSISRIAIGSEVC